MKLSISKRFIQSAAKTLVFASILTISVASASANTVWNLANVTFGNSPATATGSVTFNSTFTALTTFDIMMKNNPQTNYDFNPGDAIFISVSSTQVEIYANGFNNGIDLLTTTPMTNAGGTVNLVLANNSFAVGGGGGVDANGGQLTTAATTPEPASVLMSAAGAFILGLLFYRRRQTAAGIA